MAEAEAVSLERKHHEQAEIAYNRPNYREAKWDKAVKVYTVNQESCYLLVQNVHALGVTKDLLELFSLYGDINEYRVLDDYPSERYTDVYWIKYVTINSARVAKRKLDNRSFFGKSLHICYAPEYESVQETREKLQQRRRVIAQKTRDTFDKAQKEKPPATLTSDATSNLTIPNTPHAPVHPVQMSTPERGQPSVKSHDSLLTHERDVHPLLPVDYSIPGLPPLPQLPPPPNQDTADYPSTHDESANLGLSRAEALTTHSDSSASEEVRHLASEDPRLKRKMHSTVFNPAGLTTSSRVALYMETTQEKGLLASKEPARSKTRSAKHSLDQAANAQKCASTVSVAGLPITSAVVGSYPEQFSRDHSKEQAKESEAIPASARIVHSSPIAAGNKSVDQSIQSIREHMAKVLDKTDVPPAKPKLKKRKRI